MNATGNQNLGTPGLAMGHNHSISCRRSAVVNGSVSYIHAGQATDQALEFEDSLQCALTGFGLVRSVSGEVLRARGNMPNNGGDKMAVGAGP